MPFSTREFTEDEIKRAFEVHQHHLRTRVSRKKKTGRRAVMRRLLTLFNKHGFNLGGFGEVKTLLAAIQKHIERNDIVSANDNLAMKPRTARKKGLKFRGFSKSPQPEPATRHFTCSLKGTTAPVVKIALDMSKGQSTFAALKSEVAKQTGNDPSDLTLLNEDGGALDTNMIILPNNRVFHFLFITTDQNKQDE